MEKLIYLLWRPVDIDAQSWADGLLRSAPALMPLLPVLLLVLFLLLMCCCYSCCCLCIC